MFTYCVHIERVQLLSKAQQLHCPWLSWPFLCLFCGLLHNPLKRLRQSSAHSPECIGMCRSRCRQLRCPQKRLKQVSTSSSECINTCELRWCVATRYCTITSAARLKILFTPLYGVEILSVRLDAPVLYVKSLFWKKLFWTEKINCLHFFFFWDQQ